MHLLQFRAKLAGLRAHHGSILEHLGAKLGQGRGFWGPTLSTFDNLGSFQAHLGFVLEHLRAKVGLRWVFLGASWAVWRHFGALREAPGRHLEAKVGLGSIDLELTRGKKASCQNL